MTLRWLAGGSYLDVAQHYGVSSTTFYDLGNAGCDAIVETFPVVFDMSERSLEQRAQELIQTTSVETHACFYRYRGLS